MPLGAAETLASYRAATRRLLHDANADIWSEPNLTIYINKAVAQRDIWTGGSRDYKADIPLIANQDFYVFTALFQSDSVLDVVNLWVLYGNQRVLLHNPPFSELTSKFRSTKGQANRPMAWARFGGNKVCIAPPPATAYQTDWDLVVLSCVLAEEGDADPLPFPYTEPIPYYAAYRAFVDQREFDKADVQFGYFVKACRDVEGSRVGTLLQS
jgi:hypothetical protein